LALLRPHPEITAARKKQVLLCVNCCMPVGRLS